MLSDERKDDFLQLINNLKERVQNVSFKLADNRDIDGEEWNYYSDQFTKIHTRIQQLEDLVYGS